MSIPEDELNDLLDRLTPKQRRWAEAYAGEAAGNGVKACQIAGYGGSKETLAVVAYRNLRNDNIRQILDAWTESDPLITSRVERLRILAAIARGEACDEKLDTQGNRVELRVATKDRLAAIKALAEAAGEHIQVKKDEGGGLPVDLTMTQLLELLDLAQKKGT